MQSCLIRFKMKIKVKLSKLNDGILKLKWSHSSQVTYSDNLSGSLLSLRHLFCLVGVLGLWLGCRDVVATLFPLRSLSAPAGLPPPTGTTLPPPPPPKLLPTMLLLLPVLLLPLVPPPTLFSTGQASLLVVLSGTCWLGRPEPTTKEVEEEEEEEVEEVQPVESSDDSVVCWSKDCWGGDDCSTVTGDEDFFLEKKKNPC